jgi:hypothetical protein
MSAFTNSCYEERLPMKNYFLCVLSFILLLASCQQKEITTQPTENNQFEAPVTITRQPTSPVPLDTEATIIDDASAISSTPTMALSDLKGFLKPPEGLQTKADIETVINEMHAMRDKALHQLHQDGWLYYVTDSEEFFPRKTDQGYAHELFPLMPLHKISHEYVNISGDGYLTGNDFLQTFDDNQTPLLMSALYDTGLWISLDVREGIENAIIENYSYQEPVINPVDYLIHREVDELFGMMSNLKELEDRTFQKNEQRFYEVTFQMNYSGEGMPIGTIEGVNERIIGQAIVFTYDTETGVLVEKANYFIPQSGDWLLDHLTKIIHWEVLKELPDEIEALRNTLFNFPKEGN